MSVPQGTEKRRPGEAAAKAVSGTVLVVEDQRFDRDLLIRVLRSDGHQIVAAASGPEGLKLLESSRPDVILCDVVMPDMDGLEFCRQVKARPEYIPVLLVTGKQDQEDVLAGFEAGADDYITKPIEFQELKARVRNMIRIRQLQRQLEEQSERLRQANQEMEAFLRAVSHDLKSPVVSLCGLASMLRARFADRLGDEGQALLEKLDRSAQSAAALVTNLIDYARLGSAPFRPQPTELVKLVEQACSNLSAEIESAGAKIELAEQWPVVRCDPVSICQVFQNLIGNAIKFRGPEPPVIKLSCRKEPDRWVIAVQDNGIGIPPEKHREVFGLFKRLGQVPADGLGVGLATAEKIVKRHGGSVWVESQPGQGSTFYFTLPAEPAERSGQ